MEVNEDERLFSKSIKDAKELEVLYNKKMSEVVDKLKTFHNHAIHPSIKCYVVGNGLSRKGLNLNNITRKYANSRATKKSFVIGCNYLYREFEPDLLIAQDTKVLFDMVKDNVEIPVVAPLLKYNWARQNGSAELKNFYALRFPSFQMTRWNSGDVAIYVAALLGFHLIEYIGFDGGASSIYRKDDGVSFVKQVTTNRRITALRKSFDNIKINRYEDKLQSPSL